MHARLQRLAIITFCLAAANPTLTWAANPAKPLRPQTPTPFLGRPTQNVRLDLVDPSVVVVCTSVNVTVSALDAPEGLGWTKTYAAPFKDSTPHGLLANSTKPGIIEFADLSKGYLPGCLGTIAVPTGKMRFTLSTPQLNTAGLTVSTATATLIVVKSTSTPDLPIAYCSLERDRSIPDATLNGLLQRACP